MNGKGFEDLVFFFIIILTVSVCFVGMIPALVTYLITESIVASFLAFCGFLLLITLGFKILALFIKFKKDD